jgi:predicted nucleic acid-binding protein
VIVVSNTTPLIGLASIECFQLLEQLFGAINIPQAVYDEAVVAGCEEGGAKRQVQAATWIKIVPVKDSLAVDMMLGELDLGEAETIVLAREIGADWVLMDEKKGRRKLTQLGMPKIGTLGILLKAKQVGLLSTIQPEIARFRQLGFSISPPVVEAVLRQAGESTS